MTVVNVYGDVNGYNLICTYIGNDHWVTNAPPCCPDGSYICSFWAKDDAGNIAYRTAILWIVDGRLMCIQWIDDVYNVEYQSDNIECRFVCIRGCRT